MSILDIKKGLILKAISGFYYVLESESRELFECKAKGAFRNENQSPLVGDNVCFEDLAEVSERGYRLGVVSSIETRKNEFRRPPLANLDKLFIVAAVCEPFPSYLVIDKLITVCEYKKIEPIIVVTKTDLKEADMIEQIYKDAGFEVVALSNLTEASAEPIKELLKNSISAFAGNTGVGKSSLLNNISPALKLETAHISKKLGRGRHTTRHVELYYLDSLSCYVADTPGFGSMEMLQYEIIKKDELQYCFREFAPFVEKCKYTGCSHTVEKGCAVLDALKAGAIPEKRHESYCSLYNDAKQIKHWEV